uniref:Leptin receptor n=1 Tax=Leptobrachium leishanense TaxID=445787 RepID=A0A8C5Q2Y5_9ANUR
MQLYKSAPCALPCDCAGLSLIHTQQTRAAPAVHATSKRARVYTRAGVPATTMRGWIVDLFWIGIFTIFLRWEFIQVVASQPGIYRLPPSGTLMSCMLSDASSNSWPQGRVLQNATRLAERHDLLNPSWDAHCQDFPGTQENLYCCLWDEIHSDVSGSDEFGKSKSAAEMFPSDFTWKLQCWTRGSMDRLNCEITLLSNSNHALKDGRPNQHYSLTSQNGGVESAECNCLGYTKCDCLLPLAKFNESCTLWLKILNDTKEISSPGISINPTDMVKSYAPDDVKMEVTDDGSLKLLWSGPKSTPFDLQYQVKYSLNTSANSSQVYLLVNETSVIIGDAQPCTILVVEVRCRGRHGSGVWSDWSVPVNFNAQGVYYFPQKVLSSAGSNVTIYCTYCDRSGKVPSKEIKWWFNSAEKVPERQYSVVSDYVGKVTLVNLNATKPKGKFNYDVLYGCIQSNRCHHQYAEIHILDTNINISCQTDGRQTTMTCRWDTKRIPLQEDMYLELKYYRSKLYCSDTDRVSNASRLADCRLQSNGFYQCIFQSIYILSGYTMWIEIKHPLGILYSPPQCVMPADVVKPLAPSQVHAHITEGAGDMYVSWQRPTLPAYELQYQVRYRVHQQETAWKVIDVFRNESVTIRVLETCAQLDVQVRCRRSDGAGYWSEWSQHTITALKDIRAPLKGPDFWRIIQNNPIQRGDNITLIWQPLAKEYSLCSVRGYKVNHQVAKNTRWSEDIGNATTHTFTTQDDSHTVTVVAINSLGPSSANSNLTFSHEISTVNVLRSFAVYLINSSSVVAVWTLLPSLYTTLEFVIEWRNLREAADTQWRFIPSNVTRYYIEDSFFGIEKYEFSLYPIFAEGIGSPTVTYEFTTVDLTDGQNDPGLYVILPIIILSSLLLAGTLMVSHQRMKQMFWKDIPNPKYCSWAQGVNFQKPDTLENLFIKHHECLAPSSAFLLELETSFENLSIDPGFKKEPADDILMVNSLFTQVDDPDHDSACATSSSCGYEDGGEEVVYPSVICQSSVKYASIINNNNQQQKENYINERKPSVSSFDGCILENKTLVIGNLEEEKQSFIMFMGLQSKQPSKRSSNSTVSSEGFSEPSDHEESFGDFCVMERSLYYVGLDSSQQSEDGSYFSENPPVTYSFRENISYKQIDFEGNATSELIDNAYGSRGSGKNVVSYMPQFQTHNTSLEEMSEEDIYDLHS